VSMASVMLSLLTLLGDDQSDHPEQGRLGTILLCLYNDGRSLS